MIVDCPVCAARDYKLLMTPEDVEREREWLVAFHESRGRRESADVTDFTQSEAVNLMMCSLCGTVVRNPQPTPRELRRRYRHDAYGTEVLEELRKCEERFYAEKADLVEREVGTGALVLEVGSFVGAFLAACKCRSLVATGIDVGTETCQFAQDSGFDVICEDFLKADIQGLFDAVCIWNTFDQMNEPQKVLERGRKLLKKGGRLFLRVPNGEFKSRALKGAFTPEAQAYNNFLTFPYLFGYTKESLSRFLHQAGFEVKSFYGETIMPLAGKDGCREEAAIKHRVENECSEALRKREEFLFPWMTVVAVSTEN